MLSLHFKTYPLIYSRADWCLEQTGMERRSLAHLHRHCQYPADSMLRRLLTISAYELTISAQRGAAEECIISLGFGWENSLSSFLPAGGQCTYRIWLCFCVWTYKIPRHIVVLDLLSLGRSYHLSFTSWLINFSLCYLVLPLAVPPFVHSIVPLCAAEQGICYILVWHIGPTALGLLGRQQGRPWQSFRNASFQTKILTLQGFRAPKDLASKSAQLRPAGAELCFGTAGTS